MPGAGALRVGTGPGEYTDLLADLQHAVGDRTSAKGTRPMGLIQAAIGALGGTLADQWKDFYTVPEGLPPTAA